MWIQEYFCRINLHNTAVELPAFIGKKSLKASLLQQSTLKLDQQVG